METKRKYCVSFKYWGIIKKYSILKNCNKMIDVCCLLPACFLPVVGIYLWVMHIKILISIQNPINSIKKHILISYRITIVNTIQIKSNKKITEESKTITVKMLIKAQR